MKPNFLALFTLAGMIALSGCEESGDPVGSNEDITQEILDRLEKNEGISYQMFDLLNERMTSDSLEILKRNSDTQEIFINVVATQTDDYFYEVVEGGISEFDVTTIPTPFSGEAEITLKSLASTPVVPGTAPIDVVGEYSKVLLKRIEEKAKDGHKEWIIIEASGSTSGKSKPTETLSLNFEKIKFMATIPHTIIMDLTLTDDQVLDAINDVLNANEIPPVAIGLLLPAVQKVREANASNEPFQDAMNAWLEGPIAQTLEGNLDRDIIRRIQATVYLAALHAIIRDEYVGTNPDMASLSVLHARYRAALIMGTKEVWVD